MNDENNNEQLQDDELEQNVKKSAKKAGKEAARQVARVAKELAKKAISALVKAIGIKGILIILAVIVVIVLLAGFWYGIKENLFKDVSEIAHGITEDGSGQITDITTINERELEIDTEELERRLDEWFEEKNINKETVGISEDYNELKKFLEAEIVTLYPDLRLRNEIGTQVPEGKLQGCVIFNRNYEDGSSEVLEYTPYDEFILEVAKLGKKIDEEQTQEQIYFTKTEVEEHYNDLKRKFTLDENNNLILVGMHSSQTLVTFSDYAKEEGNIDGTGNAYIFGIDVKKVNYQSVIEKYSMPFEVSLALLMTSQNSGYCEAVADLAKKSNIYIDIQDNATTSVLTDVYSYDSDFELERYVKYRTVTETEGALVRSPTTEIVTRLPATRTETINTYDPYPMTGNVTLNNSAYKTTVQTLKNINVYLCVKSVNTWITEYTSSYTNNVVNEEVSSEWLPEEDEIEFVEVTDYHSLCDTYIPISSELDIMENRATTKEKKYNKKMNSATNTTSNTYTKSTSTVIETPEKFLSLLKIDPNTGEFDAQNLSNNTQKLQYKNIGETTAFSPENNLLSSLEVLYSLISSNSRTVNFEDTMKYLFDLYQGKVTLNENRDFSIYEPGNFYEAGSGIYGSSVQEKVWFALKNLGYSDYAVAGAMGNIDYESSGFSTVAVEGGSGEGIGLCQWSFGRKTQLIQYAESKGLSWQDEDTQIEFLVAEISGQGVARDYANQRTKGTVSGNTYTSASWASATTINDATLTFMVFFESPSNLNSLRERQARAQNYYNQFNGREAPVNTNIELTGENANKMLNMINRAYAIASDDTYQYSQANRNEEFYYDCSSFVSRLYVDYFGISRLDSGRNETGTENIRKNCERSYQIVSLTSLQPGDILWKNGHTALYIGDNTIVEAKGTNYGIVVDTLTAGRFVKAYRIIY